MYFWIQFGWSVLGGLLVTVPACLWLSWYLKKEVGR
jgi:hypothetical protein